MKLPLQDTQYLVWLLLFWSLPRHVSVDFVQSVRRQVGEFWNKKPKIAAKHRKDIRNGIYGDDPLPWLGFLRGVFLANHFASTDNLQPEQPKDRKYTNKN